MLTEEERYKLPSHVRDYILELETELGYVKGYAQTVETDFQTLKESFTSLHLQFNLTHNLAEERRKQRERLQEECKELRASNKLLRGEIATLCVDLTLKEATVQQLMERLDD